MRISRLPGRLQKTGRLVQRLLVLRLRHAVRHDAATGVKTDLVAALHGRADGDVPVTAAIKAKPADRAGVAAALMPRQPREERPGALLCLAGQALPRVTGSEGPRFVRWGS